jgi:hypothetical protein
MNMQSTTVLVNYHNDCPKCGAGINDGSKTCGSCGSVSSHEPSSGTLILIKSTVLPGLSQPFEQHCAWDGVVGEVELLRYPGICTDSELRPRQCVSIW